MTGLYKRMNITAEMLRISIYSRQHSPAGKYSRARGCESSRRGCRFGFIFQRFALPLTSSVFPAPGLAPATSRYKCERYNQIAEGQNSLVSRGCRTASAPLALFFAISSILFDRSKKANYRFIGRAEFESRPLMLSRLRIMSYACQLPNAGPRMILSRDSVRVSRLIRTISAAKDTDFSGKSYLEKVSHAGNYFLPGEKISRKRPVLIVTLTWSH